jgi:hypothetical protein
MQPLCHLLCCMVCFYHGYLSLPCSPLFFAQDSRRLQSVVHRFQCISALALRNAKLYLLYTEFMLFRQNWVHLYLIMIAIVLN